jgi:hypothetical protein
MAYASFTDHFFELVDMVLSMRGVKSTGVSCTWDRPHVAAGLFLRFGHHPRSPLAATGRQEHETDIP